LLCCAAATARAVPDDALERQDGPTRMDALLGNGHLTVGLTQDAVITMLRWPAPGFHDQLHHVTARAFPSQPHPRSLPRMGAGKTDGIHLGVLLDNGTGPRVLMLDDPAFTRRSQGYVTDTSRVARFQAETADVRVMLDAFVALERDVLTLRMEVTPLTPVVRVAAVVVAHPAPSARKYEAFPVADFLNDNPDGPDPNGFAAAWDEVTRAVVSVMPRPSQMSPAHVAALPWQTGQETGGRALLDVLSPLAGAAWVLGCDRPAGFQVGAADDGAGALRPMDAWADLLDDGVLQGNSQHVGDHTVALTAELPTNGTSEVAFYVAMAGSPSDALVQLSNTRATPARTAQADLESTTSELPNDVALPNSNNARVVALALRSLITLDMLTDAASGSVVQSAATQPALGIDRPTDAALTDWALGQAARLKAAVRHRLWWTHQHRAVTDESGGVGSLPGGFYSDGELGSVVAMPVDGLGLSLWADGRLVDRSLTTVELADPTALLRGLRDQEPAAVDALLALVDGTGSLPLAGDQWDRPAQSVTVWQATAVHLGLREASLLMGGLGEQTRADAADVAATAVAKGRDGLLDAAAVGETPLFALAMALGEGEALLDDLERRGARLDEALTRLEALLNGNSPQEVLPTLAAWQLLVACKRDRPRLDRARALVDRMVEVLPSPLGHVGLLTVPVHGAQGELILEQRAGQPAAAAQATLYLMLLERHGRKPPPSLPVPDLSNCSCPGVPGKPAGIMDWGAFSVGVVLMRRVRPKGGKTNSLRLKQPPA
jgi:hypothetical protein